MLNKIKLLMSFVIFLWLVVWVLIIRVLNSNPEEWAQTVTLNFYALSGNFFLPSLSIVLILFFWDFYISKIK